MSSNWKILKKKLDKTKGLHEVAIKNSKIVKDHGENSAHISKKRKREINDSLQANLKQTDDMNEENRKYRNQNGGNHDSDKEKTIGLSKKYKNLRSKIVALDCEMVGIGLSGKHNALARCSIVDFYGTEIYDKFVRPPALVTDFRTKYSGIRKKDLRIDHAISLSQCQEEVAAILKDKILVGHALKNDLSALMLKHKKSMIRDTATFRSYMRPHGKKGGKFKPRALRDLSKQFLSKVIQTGEHDSCEDARAALNLYKLKQEEWEEGIKLQVYQRNLKHQNNQDEENQDEDDENDEEREDIIKNQSSSTSDKLLYANSIFGLEKIQGIRNIPIVSITEADQRAKKSRQS